MHQRGFGDGGPRVSAIGLGCMGMLVGPGSQVAKSRRLTRRSDFLRLVGMRGPAPLIAGRDPQNAGTPSRCGCSAPSGDVSGRCSASTIPAGASHTHGMALTARIPVASRPWSLALSPSR
jgi:hypothetical protein